MLLLKADELAEKLRLPSAKSAKALMVRWGVQPYDLGRGRGMGLRWAWDDVLESLESKKLGKKRTQKRTRLSKNAQEAIDFFEMSAKDRREYLKSKGVS